MESNNLENNPAAPLVQLLSFAFIWLCCASVGSLLVSLFTQGNNWTSIAAIVEQIQNSEDGDLVNQLRYVQIIGHLSNYFLPALIFIVAWYRPKVWAAVQLSKAPPLKITLISLVAVFTLFPFISWVYYWNMNLIPADWVGQDKLELQAAFLNMRNGYELLLNIFLLGVVAALGEELVFRGIIQRILTQWSGQVHSSAFITAALFSFIHFQWEGFAARFLLGLLFCYLLIYTQNLWVPILLHFCFNSIQVIIPYFNPEMVKAVGETTEIPLLVALLSLGTFGIIWKTFILNKNKIYK
jgi:membrane protease YdiL (CAAX protease family)